MRQFALKAEGQSFNCDTDGRVLDSANVIGTWTTTSDNKIRIIRQVGDETEVPVQWRFNESNQLTLTQGGTVVFTAINTPQGLPRYRLVKNALVVDPDGDGDFEFTLSCRWGMDAAGTLKVSISGSRVDHRRLHRGLALTLPVPVLRQAAGQLPFQPRVQRELGADHQGR